MICVIISLSAVTAYDSHSIQEELQQVATEWNHHTIRPTSSAYVPAGCPEVLYFMPDIYSRFASQRKQCFRF